MKTSKFKNETLEVINLQKLIQSQLINFFIKIEIWNNNLF